MKHETSKTSKKNGADTNGDPSNSKSYNVFRSEMKKPAGATGDGTDSKHFGNFAVPKSVRKPSMSTSKAPQGCRFGLTEIPALCWQNLRRTSTSVTLPKLRV